MAAEGSIVFSPKLLLMYLMLSFIDLQHATTTSCKLCLRKFTPRIEENVMQETTITFQQNHSYTLPLYILVTQLSPNQQLNQCGVTLMYVVPQISVTTSVSKLACGQWYVTTQVNLKEIIGILINGRSEALFKREVLCSSKRYLYNSAIFHALCVLSKLSRILPWEIWLQMLQ